MLSGTRITDAGLRELRFLTKLTSLDLSGTKITGAGLKELAGLKNLVRLDLSGEQLTDGSLRVLRENDMLGLLFRPWDAQSRRSGDEITTFGFLHTQVTDAGLAELAGLKNLKHLSLQTPKITGTGFKALTGLKKLTDIAVRDTPLSDAGMRAWPGSSICGRCTCTAPT